IKCASVLNKFGDVELSWVPPTPRDTFNTFADYEIWGSTNAAGPYFLIDSVYGSLSEYYTLSKTIPNALQTSILGTHAQNTSLYFKMYTRCGCDSDSISIASNIVETMKPIATQGAGGVVDLVWNPVHNPLLTTSSNKYWIYKEFPIGTWTLIDSTTHPDFTYTDPTTNTICDDTITYRILTRDDSLNCTSWSAFAGIHVINNAPICTITPNNPSFCAGQNVVITANPNTAATYQWSTGATTQSITVSAAASYCVTLTFNPGGCTSDTCITVNTIPLPTANVSGTASICTGQNTNLTFTFTGTGPWNYSYNTPTGVVNASTPTSPVVIAVSPATTFNYTLTGVTTGSCVGNISGSAVITVNTIPTATLSGTTAICAGQNANLTVTFANGPGPYTFTYNPGSVVVNTALNPYVFPVTPGATTNYTLVSMSNVNCPGTISGNATVTVNTIPSATLSGTTAICAGQSGNLTFTFTGTGPWHYTYLANGIPSAPLIANTSPAVISVTPAGTTTYTLSPIVTDANCTGNTAGTATITVVPLPTAQISGSATVCAGTSTNLTINFTGTAPFVYSYLAGATLMGPYNTNLNSVTIPVTPASTTVYTLTPTLTGAGCTGNTSGSATVTVNQLP